MFRIFGQVWIREVGKKRCPKCLKKTK